MGQESKKIKYAICGLFILALAMLCSACAKKQERAYPETVKELNGLRAGSTMGSMTDAVVDAKFPDSSLIYFNNYADLTEALITDKVDYFIADKMIARNLANENPEIKVIDESVYDMEFGFVFKKDDAKAKALREQFDEFIDACHSDGRLQALEDKWINTEDAAENPPGIDRELSGENGEISLATTLTFPPYTILGADGPSGMDIELFYMFCREYGYKPVIDNMEFGAIIAAVSSGKYSLGGAAMTITEERSQSADFSHAYTTTGLYPVVMNKEAASGGIIGIINSIRESFYKTFVKENRWKMILDGLLVTLVISAASAFIGTIAGFLAFLASRKSGRKTRKIIKGIEWVFSGLPMVVILMIMYYIIFAKSNLTGVVVAIIAFSISIGIRVNSLLTTSVLAVDKGQIEGSLSLGFTEVQTLFYIVLPKAMKQFLPNYLSALIELIKGTSIVGYIAAQDLTKASDIIRNRTYDAFFPLITTAIIYLLIIVLVSALLEGLIKKFEPQRRSEEKILRRFGR